MKRLSAWVVAGLVSLPATAGAFSFGTFLSGDRIASIVLSPGAPNPPTVEYTTATDRLTFEAYVSTINMVSGQIFNIAAGDVLFTSTLYRTGTPFYGFPPYGNNEFVTATFANGLAADFSIVDLAAGANLLMAGDYTTALTWKATQGLGTLVRGDINGSFVQSGGDPAFLAASYSLGLFNSFHTGFTSNGGAVTNLCGLVLSCPAPSDLANWEANPNMVIQVPEPATLALALLGLLGLHRGGRRVPAR